MSALLRCPCCGAFPEDAPPHPSAREMEVMRAKLQVAEARFERAMRILVDIHALLVPGPIDTPDGQKFYFRDPDAATTLFRLSERIRAIPDEIDRAAVAGAEL